MAPRDIPFMMVFDGRDVRYGGNGRDEFGKETGQRTVLLLDRILPTARTSGSQLLELPVELLADIVEVLFDDRASLANLALVNVECRQMARSAQFAEISFDYSPKSHELLRKLASEASERQSGVPKPSIGACIRCITVQSNKRWLIRRYPDLHDASHFPTSRLYSDEQRAVLKQEANEIYTSTYYKPLVAVISNAMPNIQAIAWKERNAVDESFFQAIVRSSVRLQHLKLPQSYTEDQFIVQPPLSRSSWPLRSLQLGFHMIGKGVPSRDLCELTRSLLHLCAPTLESFVWTSELSYTEEDSAVGWLSLPRLRRFRIEDIPIAADTLMVFLSAPLKELELHYREDCYWYVCARRNPSKGSH